MEQLFIQDLKKYNSQNSRHREIANNNNAIMLAKIEQRLKHYQNEGKIKFKDDKHLEAMAHYLTVLGITESAHYTKTSGVNNFFGIKLPQAKKAEAEKLSKMDGRELDYKMPPATLVRTTETEGTAKKIDDYFVNYKSVDAGIDGLINELLEKYPKALKATSSKDFVYGLAFGEYGPYATDMLRRNYNPGYSLAPVIGQDRPEYIERKGKDKKGKDIPDLEVEMNPFFNQYLIKFNMFLGHDNGATGYYAEPRPDLTVINVGKDEIRVPSDLYRRTGKMRLINGLYNKKYMNKDLHEKVRIDPSLFQKVAMQKENVNNNINPKYAKDYTSLDFVHRNVTKEQFLKTSIASNIGTGNLSFQEIIQDIYKLDGEIGFESKDFEIGTKADTIVDSTGENLTDLNFEFFGRTDGFELYGGQRQGKTFFGGKLNKEITPGVRIKGGIEQEDNLKRGNIGLEVDLK